jgi:hypothetical protein
LFPSTFEKLSQWPECSTDTGRPAGGSLHAAHATPKAGDGGN